MEVKNKIIPRKTYKIFKKNIKVNARVALHAYSIEFIHPHTNEKNKFIAQFQKILIIF